MNVNPHILVHGIYLKVADASSIFLCEATNLAVHVLGWRGVASFDFRSTLGMQLKVWLVRKHHPA